MQSTPLSHLLPRVDLVYAKTVMGQHEVKHRGAGLTARQRAALIMLDGQRDASVLAGVMPAGEVASILAALLARDLIAAAAPDVEEIVAAPEPAAEVVALPSAETGKLAAIKAELIVTAETYLGVMSTEIVARVRQASDEAQLLRVLGHWHMAMQASKNGKDAARTLLERSKLQLA
jgi:hypothetical protein